MSRRTPYPGVPIRARFGGYVYAVLFDNGTVKVGHTTDPGERIQAHCGTAAAFGVAITEVWVSPLHDDYTRTEQVLIALASQLADGQRRSEYFVGVDFDVLVEQAKGLAFPPVDVAAHEATERRDFAYRRQLVEMLRKQQEPVEPEPWNLAIRRAIGRLFGRLDESGQSYTQPLLVTCPDPDDPDLSDLLRHISDLRRVPLGDVLDMTYIDVLRSMVESAVQTEALLLEIWAARTERHDLLRPVWRMPVSVDPPA